MASDKDELWCEHCGKRWKMSVLGELSAAEGITEFPHIPDWFEWERAQVRRQVEDGSYFFMDRVRVESLPNAKGYIDLGEATLTHSADGFVLEKLNDTEHLVLEKKPLSLYSLHIEFNYLGKKGDCLDLSTTDNTYYLYPLTQRNVVTKLQFAVEEIYRIKEGEMMASRTGRSAPCQKRRPSLDLRFALDGAIGPGNDSAQVQDLPVTEGDEGGRRDLAPAAGPAIHDHRPVLVGADEGRGARGGDPVIGQKDRTRDSPRDEFLERAHIQKKARLVACEEFARGLGADEGRFCGLD